MNRDHLGRDAEGKRDRLLRRLLETPPQPRPKRDRGNGKPTQTGASRANAKKREPSA